MAARWAGYGSGRSGWRRTIVELTSGYILLSAYPPWTQKDESAHMAQLVTRTFIDDIDGSEAERTFTFAVDGTQYEIDLSTSNIAEFKSAIGGFIESGRKVKPGNYTYKARSNGSSSPGRGKEQLAAARAWLRANGYSVQDRGRIKAKLLEKFDAAHQPAAEVPAHRAWA